MSKATEGNIKEPTLDNFDLSAGFALEAEAIRALCTRYPDCPIKEISPGQFRVTSRAIKDWATAHPGLLYPSEMHHRRGGKAI